MLLGLDTIVDGIPKLAHGRFARGDGRSLVAAEIIGRRAGPARPPARTHARTHAGASSSSGTEFAGINIFRLT